MFTYVAMSKCIGPTADDTAFTLPDIHYYPRFLRLLKVDQWSSHVNRIALLCEDSWALMLYG